MNQQRIAALEAADAHLRAAHAAPVEASVQHAHTDEMRKAVREVRGRLARAIEAERRG